MADPVEFEIRADTREAVNDLKKLEQQLEDVGDEAEGAGGATEGFSTKLTAATVAGAALVAGLREAVATIKEMAAEYERTAGIINRFSGDISNASERVSGLISNLDLMIEQNKLAAAGFELTAEEFGALAVAAGNFAKGTGEDATAVMQQLTQAVITGGEELIKFDVDISNAKDATDKQIAAITQLTQRYRGQSVQMDSLIGRITTMDVEAENLRMELIEQINASGQLERELAKLADVMDRLGVGFSSTGVNAIEFGDVITGVLVTATEKIRIFAEAVDLLASGEFRAAFNRALEMGDVDLGRNIVLASAERQGRDLADAQARNREGEAGGIGSRVPGNVARAGGGAEAAEMTEEERRALEALNAEKDRSIEIEQARRAFEEEQHQRAIERINQEKDREIDLHVATLEMLAERKEAEAELLQTEAAIAAKKEAAADAEMAKIQATTQTAIQAGSMLLEAFGATQGQMELFQGISDAAMAVTKFASQDYGSGALFLISSGMHFANAAQMGVGGGSNAGAAAGAAGAGASARPVASGDGGGGGGGPTNYTVNINSPVTERDVGRMQRRAEQERSRRFDARV